MGDQAVPQSVHARILQLRLRLSLLRLRLAIEAGFDPDRPRDQQGRWTDGVGQAVVTRTYRTGNKKIDSNTDILIDVTKEAMQIAGRGSGPLYGLFVHQIFAAKIKELNLPGIGNFGVEESFSMSETARYGLDGTVRTDVVLRDGRTREAPILAVWDLKTGTARLEPKRVQALRAALGIDESVPVIDIHVDRGVRLKAAEMVNLH